MIRVLRTYLRPYRRQIVLVMVLLLFQAVANLYLPALNADIINNGVAKGDNAYIIQTGAVMLGVTLVFVVCAVAAVYWGARVAMGFGRDVRSALFRKVESFSQVEINTFGTASLITRNTNDVMQVQMVVFMALTVIILAPITGIGGVILAINQDVVLSGLLLIVLPIMFLVIAIVMRKAVPLFRSMQAKLDRINQVMRETLSGVRVIRAFVRTKSEEERFDTANQSLFETAISVNRLFAVTIPTMMAILNLSTVAVVWFGAQRVDSGAMPIGNLTAFLSYLLQILMAVLMAILMFILVPRAAVSLGRIKDVLDTEPSIHDASAPLSWPVVAPSATPALAGAAAAFAASTPLTPSAPLAAAGNGHGTGNGSVPARSTAVSAVPVGTLAGSVEFKDVEFRYPGAEQSVLHGITFSARAGGTTAIVGSTGSGKSTLVNLIPRFYDVSSGKVLVDGLEVRMVRREDLWKRIAIIPQRAFLFSGTIASNLRFGDEEATDEQLWRALEIAQAKQFVEEMPDGLDSVVAQGGANLSGGQRQRLAIARALVKRAEIVIFDDSFSALDFRTDALLRAALRRELSDTSVIVVAQRVGTIMNADRIVVMDEGRVVGVGRHSELMESCETYREIVYSQLTPAEAKVA